MNYIISPFFLNVFILNSSLIIVFSKSTFRKKILNSMRNIFLDQRNWLTFKYCKRKKYLKPISDFKINTICPIIIELSKCSCIRVFRSFFFQIQENLIQSCLIKKFSCKVIIEKNRYHFFLSGVEIKYL